MRGFLLKTTVFFLLIVVLDIILGNVFSFINQNAKGGSTARLNYICNQSKEDILIFGSSRASHHYNTEFIKDSLELSAFNCGEDGNGIVLNYGRLLMILERYTPKFIIYDFNDDYDILKGDNHKYLGRLKPYYERNGIKDIFISVDKTEKWKMKSQLYRYNSSFLRVLEDYIHPVRSAGINGYLPLSGDMERVKITKEEDLKIDISVDTLKLAYLKKFIKICKNSQTQLVFAVSPIWYGREAMNVDLLLDLCRENNFTFIDYSDNEKYVHENIYFKDGQHLNEKGADKFTLDLIKELQKRGLVAAQ